MGLGDAYVKNREQGLEENVAKAVATWKEGLSEHPESEDLKHRLELADLYNLRGDIKKSVGDKRGASRDYFAALDNNPNHPDAREMKRYLDENRPPRHGPRPPRRRP